MEQNSDSKSEVEQSSDLEVGWNLEQQKCEMGHPLTGWDCSAVHGAAMECHSGTLNM